MTMTMDPTPTGPGGPPGTLPGLDLGLGDDFMGPQRRVVAVALLGVLVFWAYKKGLFK